MKRILISALLLSTVAFADWRLTSQGWLPDVEPWRSQGWPVYTDAARSNYDCAVRGGSLSNGVCVIPIPPAPQPPLPAQFEFGIATLDENSHWQQIIVDDGTVVPVQISNSPLTPDEAQQLRAANTLSNRLERTQFRSDLAAIRDRIITNRADVAAMTATNFPAGAQRQTINAMQRELDDTMQELQSLRKIVAQFIKGQ